jgi:glycogen debranching enzyme
MALFARQLAVIAGRLNQREDAKVFSRDADRLKQLINRQMWDERRKFYFDLAQSGERAPVKTVAAYWALLAQVASQSQARALVAELQNPATFARLHRVPTLAADEKMYDPAGGYWRGAVWAPTTTMVIRGLENYGYDDLAREIALSDLDIMGRVFQQTGTIWENYAPDAAAPGKPAKKDFVGWSGIGPILYLLEYGIGLKANAPENELTWDLRSAARQGCERFRFNGHVVSLVAEADPSDAKRLRVTVKSDGAFKLRLLRGGRSQTVHVKTGEQLFSLR